MYSRSRRAAVRGGGLSLTRHRFPRWSRTGSARQKPSTGIRKVLCVRLLVQVEAVCQLSLTKECGDNPRTANRLSHKLVEELNRFVELCAHVVRLLCQRKQPVYSQDPLRTANTTLSHAAEQRRRWQPATTVWPTFMHRMARGARLPPALWRRIKALWVGRMGSSWVLWRRKEGRHRYEQDWCIASTR